MGQPLGIPCLLRVGLIVLSLQVNKVEVALAHLIRLPLAGLPSATQLLVLNFRWFLRTSIILSLKKINVFKTKLPNLENFRPSA